MRFKYIFLFALYYSICGGQTFEYNRAWGTYYGPANSHVGHFLTSGGIFLNPLNTDHIYVPGIISLNLNLPASYYNQFITPGGKSVNLNYSYEGLVGSFQGGNLLTSTYTLYSGVTKPIEDRLIAFDSAGRGIYLKYSQETLPDTGTAGTWFPADPVIVGGTTNYHTVLYKKDSSGTVLWKTYLPEDGPTIRVIQDEVDNIYLYGTTEVQQGLATAGTYKPDFEVYYPPSSNILQPNAYAAKLNSNGALQWATYLPASDTWDFAYYNGNLYIAAGPDVNPSHTQLATSGAWQAVKARHSITKLDTATGNRSWGTYFGNPASSSWATTFINGIQVNASGIYIAGLQLDLTNSAVYFATLGAYKTQISGYSDLFLTKFTLDGNRVWGTYFGSDAYENVAANSPLTLLGNDLLIAGSTEGLGNNIATPGAYQDTKPSTIAEATNLYFAKFDANGNLKWCSYYGGAAANPSMGRPEVGVFAKNAETFYLYGSTTASTGIATPGSYQPQLPANISSYRAGFLARFDLKESMATTETEIAADLNLYNNPNNGNFGLHGSILAQKTCKVTILDASGRVVHQQRLPKQKEVNLNLEGLLVSGSYVIQVEDLSKNKLKIFKMVVRPD